VSDDVFVKECKNTVRASGVGVSHFAVRDVTALSVCFSLLDAAQP
jgi:hypothetical protein